MMRPPHRASFYWKETNRKSFLLHNPFYTLWHKIAPHWTFPALVSLFGRCFNTRRSHNVELLSIGSATWTSADLKHKGLGRLIQRPECVRTPGSFTDWEDPIRNLLFMKHLHKASSFILTQIMRCQTSIRIPAVRTEKQIFDYDSRKGQGENWDSIWGLWAANPLFFSPQHI